MFATTTDFHRMSIKMDDDGTLLRIELRDIKGTIVKAREYKGASRKSCLKALDAEAEKRSPKAVHSLMWALLGCSPRLAPKATHTICHPGLYKVA